MSDHIGGIEPGYRADFVAVDTGSVRLAGATDPVAATVFAATSGDVTHVVRDGKTVVADRRHLTVGDVSEALTTSIGKLYG